jgi:hypothetical protein
MVVHICNPWYSENGGKENCGLRPAWAKLVQDPLLKKVKVKEYLPSKHKDLSSILRTQKKKLSF